MHGRCRGSRGPRGGPTRPSVTRRSSRRRRCRSNHRCGSCSRRCLVGRGRRGSPRRPQEGLPLASPMVVCMPARGSASPSTSRCRPRRTIGRTIRWTKWRAGSARSTCSTEGLNLRQHSHRRADEGPSITEHDHSHRASRDNTDADVVGEAPASGLGGRRAWGRPWLEPARTARSGTALVLSLVNGVVNTARS
jgi:hypothetical protein